MKPRKTDAVAVLVAVLGLLVTAVPVLAQTGSISGIVRNADTGEVIAGAHLAILETNINALSRADGRFSMARVPSGEQTIRARVLGFAALEQSVMVQSEQDTNVELRLEPQAIALMEIVVTGSVGATSRAKLPFTVDQLRAADLPVTQVNAASAIQGKVAGATVVSGSGRPGSAPSILLRGATSISASGRDQEPLYIVDGVILGSTIVDIDGLDIDQIEVVKGAAAASLYGSRAANGVVVITTRRGSQFDDGQVRYTARTNLGVSDLPGEFPILQRHFWEMNEAGTRFIAADGSECDFVNCPGNIRLAGQRAEPGGARNQWNTFATNPWPGGAFDQVGRFFDGGNFHESYISASGRQGQTNFHVSFSRTDDQGPMLGQDGFRRNNFRLNLDQVVRPDLQVAASAFYSNSTQEGFVEGSGNPVFGLTRMQAGVNLAACEGDPNSNCLNEPERLILNANPTNLESPNPLYELLVRQSNDTRSRFLASTNLRYSPTPWFDIDGDVSYDRLDREFNDLRPKGFRTIEPDPSVNDGTLFVRNDTEEALNASITGSFRLNLTDRISNRTQLRYLYEQQDFLRNDTGGREFGVAQVPTLGNLNQEFVTAASLAQTVRADGYFIITNFDIDDRYIIDALLRNDGSSLFGADERRHWYGRIAGAWRLGAEPWFDVDWVDEFKLRYSYGTAGGRPNFSAQFETFSVAGGTIIPVNLGNRDLKPEHATEQEMGIDVGFGQRFDLSLTYATTDTENQILPVPLPAFSGFSTQVRNVGTLQSQTWEASLGARLLQTQNVSWSARLLYDNTVSKITQLDVPQFRYGVAGQNMGNVFLAREGERLGTFYGPSAARSCENLPTGSSLSCDQFTVDENGFLVWVGSGGLGDNLWGTQSPEGHDWGTPFSGECTDGITGERTTFCRVGNTMPDYTVSLSSTLTWRGLSVYGLLDAVQGFDVWNQPLSWALFRRNIDMMNQADVSENERKPIGYFDALYGGMGGLVTNDVFVEDASFVKLRELSVSYRLSADQLERVPGMSGFHSIGLSASGRNLKTWSDYRGYDPEVGRAGGDTGSAALARVDGFNYPNFRTWTFGVELTF